jgi:hypothetical protein
MRTTSQARHASPQGTIRGHVTVTCLAAVVMVAGVVGLGSLIRATMTGPPPACAEEDSPGPCTWDAQHRGNLKGASFTVGSSR